MVIYPLFICWQVINFHSLSHTGFNPLENMSSSVGMMTFPTEWKVIKFHGSKPPTSIFCIIKPWLNPTSLHLVPWICSSPDSPIDPSPVALVVAPLPPSPVPLAVLRDGRALRPGYCRRRSSSERRRGQPLGRGKRGDAFCIKEMNICMVCIYLCLPNLYLLCLSNVLCLIDLFLHLLIYPATCLSICLSLCLRLCLCRCLCNYMLVYVYVTSICMSTSNVWTDLQPHMYNYVWKWLAYPAAKL